MKVIILMAQTVDGFIARHSNHVVDWTGKDDKKLFMEVTKKAGVVVMGSNTFKTMGKPLPGRFNLIMTQDKNLSYKGVQGSEEFAFVALRPEYILQFCKSLGHETVYIIGGSKINSLFIEAGLVDEIHVTIISKLFGTGIGLFADKLDLDLDLLSAYILKRDRNILLKYKVRKGSDIESIDY